MIGAGVHLYIYRAVCRNFAKWGRANLGYLKKRGGTYLQAASRGALEDNVKN